MKLHTSSPFRWRLAIALGLVFCPACITDSTAEIDGQDDGLLAAFRMSFPIDTARDAGDWSTGYRLQLDTWQGGFDQTMLTGSNIQVDGTLFSGVGSVAIDFDHTLAGLGMYASKPYGHLDLELAGGLAGSFLGIDATRSAVQDSGRINSVGVFLNGRAALPMTKQWASFYELSAFYGEGDDRVEIHSSQLGVTWSPRSAAAFSFGIQDADYSADRDGLLSDLQLGLGGLFLRLELAL